MSTTLRGKMIWMVAIIAVSFFLLILVGATLDSRTSSRLEQIQETYLPLVELGPRLEGEFENLKRAFQDAVASQDTEALAATIELKENILKVLDASSRYLNQTDVLALEKAINDYYQSAREISKRLVAQETGEEIIAATKGMQIKQALTESLLIKATQLDRNQLTTAFSEIGKTLKIAWQTRLLISLFCLIAVILSSLWIGRSALRSLQELSFGLSRFGRGDFAEPIKVIGSDELSSIAQQANQMANKIKSLMKELESFSYSVAHDLRAPLRSMLGFSTVLMEDFAPSFPEEAKQHLERVTAAAKRMGELIDSLLSLSRVSRQEIVKSNSDLSSIAQSIFEELQDGAPERKVSMVIAKDINAECDPRLLRIVLMNIIGNAWKFTSKVANAKIEFGMEKQKGKPCFFVRDNGAGFDMLYADKLFGTFQRLHTAAEFEGTGIGLATVKNIVQRHGGEVWAQSEVGKGTTFYFTLGEGEKI